MTRKLKQVKVNFYEEQHKILKENAILNNVTIAQFIRQELNINLDKKDIKNRYRNSAEKELTKVDEMLIYQVSKIGNNLNQIAKVLHTKKDISNVDILESLVKIEKKIGELI